jgi:hypothetical protein
MKLLQTTSDIQSSLEVKARGRREENYQEYFYVALLKLSPKEVVALAKEYYNYLNKLRNSAELRGCFRSKFDAIGDDAFDDFCCWIISMGEDCFKDATGKKVNMDKYIEFFDEGYYFEILGSTFAGVYEELTGDDIEDML